MNTTITPEQQQAIAAYFKGRHIPPGIGTEESACTVAGINLALYGRHTDDIPPCMSEVIGRWIIRTQDSMPDEMRNSAAWIDLAPSAAGTGRDPDLERRRAALIVQHMWETTLPMLQPIADAGGYGAQWRRMTTERTAAAAAVAARWAAAVAARWAAADARWAAADARWAAADARWAAADARWAAAVAARWAAADARWAAADAADAAADAADAAARARAWKTLAPIALLRALIDLE